jgi:universal stress protein A
MRSAGLWPKHIIVGVDFSEFSVAALRLALNFAEHLSATVSIVHVLPPARDSSSLSAGVSLQAAGAELTRAENHLAVFIRRVIGRRSMPPYRIIQASASDGILFAAGYERAGLIVVGTRGRGGTSRDTLGSVAEQVLSRSAVPVMTVAPHRIPKRKSETIKRILCPVNLSVEAARALEFAVSIGKNLHADVIALEIVSSDATDEVMRRETHRLRHWLKAQLSRVAQVSPLVRKGDPGDDILDYAKKEQIDLIVVGAKRRRFSTETVFGTTAERVTRHAPCAVLSVTSPLTR